MIPSNYHRELIEEAIKNKRFSVAELEKLIDNEDVISCGDDDNDNDVLLIYTK